MVTIPEHPLLPQAKNFYHHDENNDFNSDQLGGVMLRTITMLKSNSSKTKV